MGAGDTPVPLPEELRRDLKKEPVEFGRFLLLGRLGAGGAGEVWKAWQRDLGRLVALKMLIGRSERELERFRREARAAGALAHPNIAAIYEVGEAGGQPYLAMQLVAGQDLSHVKLPLSKAIALARDASEAVHYAHQKGIVHRDLKPQNLMIDEEGRVVVLDFGIARFVRDSTSAGGLTATGELVGTPSFMAPEQALGWTHQIDGRTDVYGLGATLYKLVTGSPPHTATSLPSLLERIVYADPIPPRRLQPPLDRNAEAVILKCLEKRPERRYATAAELAADLGRVLRGEPVIAKRASWLRRTARRVGRVPRSLLVVASFGIVFLALWILAAIPGSREHESRLRYRREAEEARKEGRLDEAARLLARSEEDSPGQGGPQMDFALGAQFEADLKRRKELAEEFSARAKSLEERLARIREERRGTEARLRGALEVCPPWDTGAAKDAVWTEREALGSILKREREVERLLFAAQDMAAAYDPPRVPPGLLRATTATLVCETDPPGATVTLFRLRETRGKWTGHEPCAMTGSVPPGTYRLEASMEGHATAFLLVRLDPGQHRPVKLLLPPVDAMPEGFAYVARDGARGFFLSREEAKGTDGRPRRNVSWREADQICRDHKGRLPRAEEWELAVGFEYPWGDGFDFSYCQGGLSGPLPSGGEDVSVAGVEALAGGVAEWLDGKGPFKPVRGGSFRDVDPEAFRRDREVYLPQDEPFDWVGFRVLKEW